MAKHSGGSNKDYSRWRRPIAVCVAIAASFAALSGGLGPVLFSSLTTAQIVFVSGVAAIGCGIVAYGAGLDGAADIDSDIVPGSLGLGLCVIVAAAMVAGVVFGADGADDRTSEARIEEFNVEGLLQLRCSTSGAWRLSLTLNRQATRSSKDWRMRCRRNICLPASSGRRPPRGKAR